MHPALRILGVILFIPLVARGGILAGVVAALGVTVLLSGLGREAWRRCYELNRRLRWLFLSIVLLYGWFTPGRELLPAAGVLSPSLEGLIEGLARAAVLVIVVGAVVWLLSRSSREELVAGLLWLTAPLARVGFPSERFAVRLALTLDTVPRLQPMVSEARAATGGAAQASWPGRASALLQRVIERAREAPLSPLEIHIPGRPPWRQWLLLCAWLLPLLILAVWRPI
ncbi:hypothetical protein B1C78_15270 [Thioalkalivibrio denitrificans]|uniref:Cobalt transporter n=1 Tax=Thioalkalivibrio denitrificans TaxID=108003 RepID=A0A1V3NBE4_9GAMM|nr:hypothetical protein [Thioalkalivibrio denitrificans]OOG22334.1 hypothetical protein B1C78_15270 [Thioalkalivibrio denitrificans]